MTLSPEGGPRKGGRGGGEEGGGEFESPARIEFQPTELDVVCTKLRSWNEKHPGNLFCAKLISARAQSVQENEIGKMRQMAKEIVHEIIEERGGRFLKISEKERNPDYCSLMAHKSCVDRVARALRTAYSNLTSPSSSSDRNKNNKDRSQSPKKQYQRKRKLKALYPHEERYEVTQGNKQIHPHALKLISLVCNCSDYRVLDQPRLDFTVENEPEKERLMRLQIRQRFASAKATGMTPLQFSQRLLKLWGGTIVEKEQSKDKQSPPTKEKKEMEPAESSSSSSPPPTESSSQLLDNNNISQTPEPTSPGGGNGVLSKARAMIKDVMNKL